MGRKTFVFEHKSSAWRTHIVDERSQAIALIDFGMVGTGDWFLAEDGMVYLKIADGICFDFATNMTVDAPPGRCRLVDVEIRIVANRE
jgi:hypothetical protein